MRYPTDHKVQTRLKVVRAAATGFRRNGIDRLSVAALMKEVGLTHGGFYSHFPSKEGLVEEALVQAFVDAQAHLWATLKSAPSGDHTRAVVSRYLSMDHVSHPEFGCPLAALGSELTRQPEEIRNVVRNGRIGLVEILKRAIEDDGLTLSAEVIVSMMVGAITIARTETDTLNASMWCEAVIKYASVERAAH